MPLDDPDHTNEDQADTLDALAGRARALPAAVSARMTLGEHLDELRIRLIFALLGLVPIVATAFYFGDTLLTFILAPARKALLQGGQSELQAINPLETFSAYMRVSVLAAVVVGSPWLVYQLWKFVAPGLHKHEKRFVYFLLPLSTVLTAVGVAFLFLVVLPIILKFLVTFGTSMHTAQIATAMPAPGVAFPQMPMLTSDPIAPRAGDFWINTQLQKMRIAIATGADGAGAIQVFSLDLYKESGIRQNYRVSETLSMMLTLVLAFAGAFQAPIVVLLLGWAKVIDRAFLRKYRKQAFLACAVIAAAVMPGDPASMISMMVPLYLLYELGGLLLAFFPASKVAGERPAPTTEDEDDRP